MIRLPSSGNICSRLIFLLVLQFSGISIHAQLLETRVNISLDSCSLDKGVLQLQQATGFSFAYEISGLQSHTVPARQFHNEKLSTVLLYLLKSSGYQFEERHNTIIIGPGSGIANEKEKVRLLKGIIEDKETGERLPGVAVSNAVDKHTGTFTDKDGYFSLPISSDTLKLELNYMSYKPTEIVLHAADASLIRIKMDVARKDLDSVMIVLPSDITRISPLSNLSPSINYLSFLPRFGGDIDLLSMTKIIPGIREANDGSGSILVRGGAPDQNLLLIDDAVLYGPTHLLGLVSSVNVNSVKEINIYKGAFPARYSGRISSVWDITLKNGNPEKFHGNISIGTFSSEFMLEGPIIKNKTTFSLSGRRSYHDYYVRWFTPGLKTFYFQDLNFKLQHRLSDKDNIYFTAYYSRDRFNLARDTSVTVYDPFEIQQYEYQSLLLKTKSDAAVLRWRHHFNAGFSSDLVFSYSDFSLDMEEQNETRLATQDQTLKIDRLTRITTGLSDFSAKLQAKYVLTNTHKLESGFYYTQHVFKPFTLSDELNIFDSQSGPSSALSTGAIESAAAHEIGGFIEDNFELTPRLKFSAGVHFNKYFSREGNNFSLQPRIRGYYQFLPKWYLDIGYANIQQSMHRLSISNTSLPIDFWIPSTYKIKPQVSNQVSAGISGKLFNDQLDLNVESYYKSMNNVVDYLANLPVDSTSAPTGAAPGWDPDVVAGKGSAYGVEISVRKSKGIFQSWLSYSLSWSKRTFPEINNGLTFPFKYDRRHSLNIISVLKAGKHLEFSGVFSIQSKAKPPVLILKSTDTSARANELKAIAASIEQIAYHRLDLCVNWKMRYKEGVNAVLNLSVLNVYNRKNTFYYFVNTPGQFISTTLMPVALSLSYTLTF